MHPFGFDPTQPGARRMAEGHRASQDTVSVRLTRPLILMDYPRAAGEVVELPRAYAAELVRSGVAEPTA